MIRPAPASATFGSMKSVACSSISQSTSSLTRKSGGRPKNRVYQSMLASRKELGYVEQHLERFEKVCRDLELI